MKKLLTLIATASFFAITFSLIDQLVWDNDFYWTNALIGFSAGILLVILGKPEKKDHYLS